MSTDQVSVPLTSNHQPEPPRARRALPLSWGVGLAAAAYVLLLAGFEIAGYRAFVWKTPLIPVLLLIALIGNHFRTFIQDWIVFLAWVVLVDAVRGFTFATIVFFRRTVYAVYPIQWEQALFGGPALGIPLQRWAAETGAWSWLGPICIPIHASHFAFFLLFGMALWSKSRPAFGRWVVVMTLMMIGGLAVYVLVPTVPPWMASRQGRIPYLTYIAGQAYNATVPTLQTVFATNPVAAMPSLHIAFPTCCALVATGVWGWRGAVTWLYVAGMAFSLIYLGEHYGVDVLAGILLALASWAIVQRWTSLTAWTEGLGWTRWTASRHFTVAMGVVLVAVLLSSWATFLLPGIPLG